MVEIARCIDFVAITGNNNLPPAECSLIPFGFALGLAVGISIAYFIFVCWKNRKEATKDATQP